MAARPNPHPLPFAYAETLIRVKARQICRRAGFNRSDEEDIGQWLWVTLLRRWDGFDPSRSSAKTFAARVVASAAASAIRDLRCLKRGGGRRPASLDQPSRPDEAAVLRNLVSEHDVARWTGEDVAPDTPETRELEAQLGAAIRRLVPELLRIAVRLMAGQRDAAIARELGVSRRQIRNAKAAIRQHLRAHGIGES